LRARRYKALILFQGDVIEEKILDAFQKFNRAGGKVIYVGNVAMKNVEGVERRPKGERNFQTVALGKDRTWLKQVREQITGLKGVDGKLDGLWTCRRGKEVLVYNSGSKAADTTCDGVAVTVEPHTIWEKR
jgi:hypothetical protein